jgi:hypothetical protein
LIDATTNENHIVAKAGAPLAELPSHTSIGAKLDALADIGGVFVCLFVCLFVVVVVVVFVCG